MRSKYLKGVGETRSPAARRVVSAFKDTADPFFFLFFNPYPSELPVLPVKR